MWQDILEIGVTIVLFLCASYLLYYKTFIKAFGKETAKLLTIEQFTKLQEGAKEEYNNRLEELKADLEHKNAEFSIQYSLLHTKRADVIIEVNRLLSALLRAVEVYTNPFVPGGTNEQQVKALNERLDKLNKSYNEFNVYYDYNKLFFKNSFCESIDSLLIDVIDVCRQQNSFNMKVAQGNQLSADEELSLDKCLENITEKTMKLRSNKMNLENEFRALLCVEES